MEYFFFLDEIKKTIENYQRQSIAIEKHHSAKYFNETDHGWVFTGRATVLDINQKEKTSVESKTQVDS